jgi:hypothetical protein
MAIVRLEGSGQMKSLVTSNLTRGLPACSIVPQPTTLLRCLLLMMFLFTETARMYLWWNMFRPVTGGLAQSVTALPVRVSCLCSV